MLCINNVWQPTWDIMPFTTNRMQHTTEQCEQFKHLFLVTLAFLLGDKHHNERKADVVITVILSLIKS